MTFLIENWFLLLAAAVSGAMLFVPMLSRRSGATGVSTSEAVQLINREKGVLIDVSEPAEYAAGHAGGSKNLPFGSLETTNDLPRNKALPLLLPIPHCQQETLPKTRRKAVVQLPQPRLVWLSPIR